MSEMKFRLFENDDNDDDAIFINPKKVTHFYRAGSGTTIFFTTGSSVTVDYNVWEVAAVIDPGPPAPAIVSSTSTLLDGSWTAGEAVTIETVHTRADGSTSTHTHKTTFTGEIEHNDYTGKDYYVCAGGSFDDREDADAQFSFDTSRFNN